MTNALVPKVTISEAAGRLGVPRANTVVIGMMGVSEQGTANQVYEILSPSMAETIFGSNTAEGKDLVKMIKAAFEEGASVIKAVSIGQPTLAAATDGGEGALTADSAAGATTVTVADATIYTAGDIVYIGTKNTYAKEERRVVDSGSSTTLTLTTPLTFPHYTGEEARIITPKAETAYDTAVLALTADEDKSIIVCDLNTDAMEDDIQVLLDASLSNYNTPCVYIKGTDFGVSASTAATKAIATNDERVIHVFPNLVDFNGRTVNPGVSAAAVAGAIAGNGVPKLNHNFTALSGFGGVSAAITDMDALISAGVTPIELKNNEIHLVRFVTTKTKTSGVPDLTWQEGAIRLNVDHIVDAVATKMQSTYLQKGNTPQTRLAMKQDIIALLDKYASMNILVANPVTGIPAYRDPVVATDSVDDTKVNVTIEVSPGKPLNFIQLNFQVIL